MNNIMKLITRFKQELKNLVHKFIQTVDFQRRKPIFESRSRKIN